MTIPRVKTRAGQSTLEFVLTLFFLMGFVLFYSRFAFLLGYANLVQYATFMSSRAYQSGAQNKASQNDAAQAVIISLLKKSAGLSGEERFGIAQAVGGGTPNGAQIGDGVNFSATDDDFSWAQGVRYSFRGRMLVGVQLFGTSATQASAPQRGNAGEVLLTSESWLGREPTTEECEAELNGRNVSGDNGC